MVRDIKGREKRSCFSPDEAAVLKLAYDDAMSKRTHLQAALGASEALAGEIVRLAQVRADLGQTISGYSDAQLLSFLAREALK